MRTFPLCVLLLWGCASSESGASADASAADAALLAPDAAGSADAANTNTAACPDGELAVDVRADGEISCAPIDEATSVAVRSRCQVYMGQRDDCDGCADPPESWSASGPLTCSPGPGNRCLTITPDGAEVGVSTVDLSGDVNGDDKLFASLHCIAGSDALRPAPCAPGWAIVGKSTSGWVCAAISEAAIDYVGNRCSVYWGWRDSCDDCTSPPSKWGSANDDRCTSGAGDDNTCVTAELGGETVNLMGVNTDGDVDGNDKFHIGLHCEAPEPGGGRATETCREGEFVVALYDDGSFDCADPVASVAAYVDDHCSLFFGWRDSCDDCAAPPTKWGRVGNGTCTNGAGADNTCASATLGGVTVELFGLSTDGDVNADDTFYTGLHCDPLDTGAN